MRKERFHRVNGDFGLRERRGTGLGFRSYLEMLGRPALQKATWKEDVLVRHQTPDSPDLVNTEPERQVDTALEKAVCALEVVQTFLPTWGMINCR